jgi:DNA polymerase-3 subunit epsilon
LIKEVRDVTWKETGSELAALLEESRLIKEHQPRHNRALKRYGRRPFIRLDCSSKYPRVSFVNQLVDDGAEYFGPVRGGRNAAYIVDLIDTLFKLRECDDQTFARGSRCMYAEMHRCLAPCVSDDTGYESEVDRVRGFLMGKDHSILTTLEHRMREAATRLEFEQAQEYRDWMQMLERMLTQQREVASPVLDHNAVILQPAISEGELQLFFVRFGRYVFNTTFPLMYDRDSIGRLRAAVQTFFNPNQLRPMRYHRQEVDEISILLNWMYSRREAVETVRWSPSKSPPAFVRDLCEAVDARREHCEPRLKSA